MRNIDALQIAKLALQEVRLLLQQKRYQEAGEIAELGTVLPLAENNTVLESLTYDKLLGYVTKYPDRQKLTHFHQTIFAIQEPKRAIKKTEMTSLEN